MVSVQAEEPLVRAPAQAFEAFLLQCTAAHGCPAGAVTYHSSKQQKKQHG